LKVLSVNVGRPRPVPTADGLVLTGIFKEPVAGRVRVGALGLDGDGQADLSVHGGETKAVYAYPSEHYAWWRADLARDDLHWGAFGENLTTEGLLEHDLGIGDRLRVGTAELVVTQPRIPCFKLGIRLERPDVVKRFLHSARSGFYFRVEREGELGAGDAIEILARADPALSVRDAARLRAGDERAPDLLRRAADHPGLPEEWRTHFRTRLTRGTVFRS
jgi:MOSC domain-containing protein YiiM